MTANEMADKLEQVYLNLTNAQFSYEDLELSSILSSAQQLYFSRYLEKSNINKYSFEETELRGWGFGPLISDSTLTLSASQIGVLENGFYFDLPADFQAIILDLPTSNTVKCNSTEKIKPMVEVISHDEYQKAIRNYYKKPYMSGSDGKFWRMYDSTKRVQLIVPQGVTIDNYRIKYLKSLPNIVVDRITPTNQVNCLLSSEPKTIHETIVKLAMELIFTQTGQQVVPNQIGIDIFN
jgi:hypothetical protein